MGSLDRFLPSDNDVIISDESPRGVNKKPAPGNKGNVEFIVFVPVGANNGDDGTGDAIYCFGGNIFLCFDGDGFVFSPAVNGEQQQSNTNGSFHDGGGPGVVSESEVRRNYRLMHPEVQ
jgi:hypothetical protein